MSQQFIIPALLILAVSSVLLTGFCVYSYRSLKKEFEQLVFDGAKVVALSESLIETAKQLDNFLSHANESEQRRSVPFDAPVAPAPAPAPANLDNRGQVMRLHRSGESVSSIASALGVSQGEVKLMVKVQELLSKNSSGEQSADFL